MRRRGIKGLNPKTQVLLPKPKTHTKAHADDSPEAPAKRGWPGQDHGRHDESVKPTRRLWEIDLASLGALSSGARATDEVLACAHMFMCMCVHVHVSD